MPDKPHVSAEMIDGLTLDQYHARHEWSNSQKEVFRKSPPLFHGYHVAKIYERNGSTALDDGTIVHECVTGGKSIHDVVALIPPEVLNKSGGRSGKAWDEWSEAHADKYQRKEHECGALFAMYESICSHSKAQWLLTAPGFMEQSIIWTDVDTGLALRARPDKVALRNSQVILADLKTTRAIAPREFSSHMAKYGYHRQLAWYADGLAEVGLDVNCYCLITVDKTPAHETHVYEVSPSAVELGRIQNRELLREMSHRLDRNDWSSRDRGDITEIDVPWWEYNNTPAL